MTTKSGTALLIAVVLLMGAAVGWEVRKVADGQGQWSVVRSRPVLAWQPTPEASALPEARTYPAVSVTRWYGYGLGFQHSQHHRQEAPP